MFCLSLCKWTVYMPGAQRLKKVLIPWNLGKPNCEDPLDRESSMAGSWTQFLCKHSALLNRISNSEKQGYERPGDHRPIPGEKIK